MTVDLPFSLISKRGGVFVTAADTGVGKTKTSCVIIRELKKKKFSVGVMKPICSGDRKDPICLKKVSGVDDSIEEINPVFLEKPLAPFTAARIQGVRISLAKVKAAYEKLRRKYDILVVEGAGGLLVPVKGAVTGTRKIYIADLAAMFELPLVVVSRPGLGAINHTLLTLECARSYGLDVLGVVFNYTNKRKKGLAEKTNPEIIAKFGRVKILGEIPFEK